MIKHEDALQLSKLKSLADTLASARTISAKIEALLSTDEFKENFQKSSRLGNIFERESPKNQLSIAAIFAIGEANIVFRTVESVEFDKIKFQKLLERLSEIETFYKELGGIVGYHFKVLNLLYGKEESQQSSQDFLKPLGHDLAKESSLLNSQIRWGIESLPVMAEIFPVGGAGDRLNLLDEKTGEPLPAAVLDFCGKSLLRLLIQDVQAKEYLYYKLKSEQIQTPIAMMTSEDKGNHKRVLDVCSRNHWFGRPKEGFYLFSQPLVPVLTAEGHWSMSGPLELYMKPGGHGALWKLAQEKGLFEWLKVKGRAKGLIRQINNPIAGTDSLLLAFQGVGVKMEKTFGFASCPRMLHTAQGMIVLVRRERNGKYEYFTSNIEYTDFAKCGLEDLPETPQTAYSKFPANTNILFVDLKGVQEAINKCPVPGMLINFKSLVPFIDSEGVVREVKGGRLESTMQNLSDCLVETADHPLSEKEVLGMKAFVVFNERRKTISVTKKTFDGSGSLLETPPGCFYELMQNNHELFSETCGMALPDFCNEATYIQQGPNLILLYHPALGPLYSVILQKVRGGRIAENSELQLEIAEADLQNVDLEGSLLIEAEEPLGMRGEDGHLHYGEGAGKCELINVTIRNRGINRHVKNIYWKNQIERNEKLHIVLRGNAEFCAENVTFNGQHVIEVPSGWRFTAVNVGGEITYKKEKISDGTWRWDYAFQGDDSILLTKRLSKGKTP